MTRNRGFTLIEALITAGIIACGLVAVAAVFAFVIRTNLSNRQMSVATVLLYDKMEELKSSPSPAAGSDQINQDGNYRRVWQVTSNTPQSITVIIYAESSPFTHRQTEILRATTLVSPTF